MITDIREKTHGDYKDTAMVAQGLKVVLRATPGWARLTHRQRESLEMIATKIARVTCGNANEPDHWIDIAGYAHLCAKGETP